jgi:hypothetical protein
MFKNFPDKSDIFMLVILILCGYSLAGGAT